MTDTDLIEEEWGIWRKKFKPNLTSVGNSKPKKKTYLKVSTTCHASLTSGKINKTQPSSIQTVIEHLAKNVKAALNEQQSNSSLSPLQDTEDKKPIAVHLNKATSNKIKTLQNKFKFSTAPNLLEFAVKYYAQTYEGCATDSTQNKHTKSQTKVEIFQRRPLHTYLAKSEQPSSASQPATIKEPKDTDPAIEQFQAIKNKLNSAPIATENKKPTLHTQESTPQKTIVISAEQNRSQPLNDIQHTENQKTTAHQATKIVSLTVNTGKTINVRIMKRKFWKPI